MHPQISQRLLTRDLNGGSNGIMIAGITGDLLWILTYFLTIRAGFQSHTYGIPLVAVCLNITWEFIFTFVVRPDSTIRYIINGAWFALDSVILLQIFRYGRADQIPEIQQNFYMILIGAIILALIGHWTSFRFFGDTEGELSAFSINLIMSILFIFLLSDRRYDLRGLSYGAAWSKMLGTAILSAANVVIIVKTKPSRYGFRVFLFISILLFDVIYIFLMHQAAGSIVSRKVSPIT